MASIEEVTTGVSVLDQLRRTLSRMDLESSLTSITKLCKLVLSNKAKKTDNHVSFNRILPKSAILLNLHQLMEYLKDLP